MNIGGLYTYPRATKDLWDSIEIGSNRTGETIYIGEMFMILEESPISEKRAHFKVLSVKGQVGWIAYIDKIGLMEVTHP